MKSLRISIFFPVVLMTFTALTSLAATASAASFFWDGSGGDNKFGTAANWSVGSAGSGTNGVPGAGDSWYIGSTGASSGNVILDTAIGSTLAGYTMGASSSLTAAPGGSLDLTFQWHFGDGATANFTGGTINNNGEGLYGSGVGNINISAGTFKNRWWEASPAFNLTVDVSGTGIYNGNVTNGYIYAPQGGFTISDNAQVDSQRGFWWTSGATVTQNGGTVTTGNLYALTFNTQVGAVYDLNGGLLKMDNQPARSGSGDGHIQLAPGATLQILGDWTGDQNLSGMLVYDFGLTPTVDYNSTLAGYTTWTSAAVPEPSSFALASLGLVGLGWFGLRRRKG